MKSSRSYSIAFVDDYRSMREFLASYLSSHGFVVTHEANNGQEFLAQLEQDNNLPDLCLLDINMPVMDGFETVVQLKEQYPTMKILAYSSDGDAYRIDKILALGAHGFIPKGSGPGEFKVALIKLMNQKSPHYESRLNLPI